MYEPRGVAVDAHGNVYIADTQNHRIRFVEAGTGIISTIAGTGEAGFRGDNGPALEAEVEETSDVAIDAAGNVFIADRWNHRIRRVDVSTGIITTVVGTGAHGDSGDGGPATQARLKEPRDVAFDAGGILLVLDRESLKLRMVDTESQIITTIAGDGIPPDSFGDGGPATAAQLFSPVALTLDGEGWIYVVGLGSNRIRIMTRANRPPVAAAGGDATLECSGHRGANLTLDGSGSTDPDSSTGTNDDIVLFKWFEDHGLESEIYLGEGMTLEVTLALGNHDITLRVTDSAGDTDTVDTAIAIVDTTAPTIAVEVDPELLWPPNHRMVPVTASVTAADVCSDPAVVLTQISRDDVLVAGVDADNAELGTADYECGPRASRRGSSTGSTYTLTYTATDAAGNESTAEAVVQVPHDQRKKRPDSGKGID